MGQDSQPRRRDRAIETERLSGRLGLDRAAELLRAGGLVAFPTETVYGLGADAADGRAVARIFAAKGRPRFNPLIVHVPDRAAAETVAAFDPAASALADAFWPGPLTLVLPRRPEAGLSDLVSAGLDTVAVRVPAGPVARDLARAVGRPIAAPSANLSGRVSPTAAEHVLDGLDGAIDAVLDAGPCAVGLESTILKPEPSGVRLLRPGGLAMEAIEAVLSALGLPNPPPKAPEGGAIKTPGAIEAPGALESHYAPGLALRLNAAAPRAGEAWLGFGPDPTPAPTAARNLSPSGDVTEAAARLFGDLRALDQAMAGQGTLAVARIPETGLGVAINDRLRRAAAPRPSTSPRP